MTTDEKIYRYFLNSSRIRNRLKEGCSRQRVEFDIDLILNGYGCHFEHLVMSSYIRDLEQNVSTAAIDDPLEQRRIAEGIDVRDLPRMLDAVARCAARHSSGGPKVFGEIRTLRARLDFWKKRYWIEQPMMYWQPWEKYLDTAIALNLLLEDLRSSP